MKQQARIAVLPNCLHNGVAFSPDGKRLAIGRMEGGIALCDAVTGKESRVLSQPEYVTSDLDWSPDGRRLATIDRTRLCIWDVASGRMAINVTLPLSATNLFWRDSDTVYAGNGSEMCVVDTRVGKLVRVIPGGGRGDACLGRGLAFFAEPGAIIVRSVATGQVRCTLVPLSDAQYAVIAPDGHWRGSRDAPSNWSQWPRPTKAWKH